MKNFKFILSALAALAVAWLFVSPAPAQPTPEGQDNPAPPVQQSAPKVNPCSADLQKFCQDAGSFGDRMKCLKDHEADLSDECKQARAKMRQAVHKRLNKAKEACQSDIDQYCKDVKEGEGRIIACLKGHLEVLTPSCKIAYDKIDIQVQRRQIMKNKAAGQQ
jgi:hypothetical protein